ncbi:MAG: NAD(P)-binding domain-containing protein [Ignavibacteria bacterium]|jgi:thioredoxin reductase (NADPH)|nr:NAD(P)-binding domain-containing protein [Ignavibacteria bacterium]MDH7526864.1 NAD(P)-binding domain-containing protein [Ignavibacteria bacterium]
MSYDIIIIGAGPAGISMAVEAKHAGVPVDKILILEKAEEHSFTIKKFYPDSKPVSANYKGLEAKCLGVMCLSDSTKEETITYLDKAIQDNNLQVHYNEAVYRIEKNENDTFTVFTEKAKYNSRIVVVAIGILSKPNKPDYKLPASLKDKIFFDVTEKEIRNSKVLVVGGGDSASEYCQYLVQNDNEVTLSYRRKDFTRMNDINRESILALEKLNKLKILRESNIIEVRDNNGKPEVYFKEANYPPMIFDYFIYALGGTTPKNFLKAIGIEFNGEQPVLKDNFETNIPGLFLVGDLSAGLKGGSINWAFNSTRIAMQKICEDYLGCKVS